MKKSEYILFSILVMMILFMCTSITNAANFKLKKKAVFTPKVLSGKPDLVVKKAVWSSTPKEGDTIGASSILNIVVLNRGAAPAGGNRLKITCLAASGGTCPSILQRIQSIPSLKSGKSMGFTWPSLSSEKWTPGRYTLVLEVDSSPGKVDESRENNNKKTIVFTVLKKNHIVKKLKPVQNTIKKRLGHKVLKPVKALAELSIQDFHIVDTNLVNGQKFESILTVKNNGGTPNSDEMYLRFITTLTSSTGSPVKVPAAGQTLQYKNFLMNNTTICGPITFTVIVDATNKVKESNENNNTAKENVMVLPLANLSILQPNGTFIAPTSVGKVNTNIPLVIKVYNNGCIATKPSRIWVGCDGQWPVSGDIPAISAGKHWTFIPSFKWTTVGVRKCTITLDYENNLQEITKGDNKTKGGQITVTD